MPERSEFNARARRPGPEHLARKLGWLSIGLGVTQVLLPRTMARLTGVPIRGRSWCCAACAGLHAASVS